jgi:hypothetical protein
MCGIFLSVLSQTEGMFWLSIRVLYLMSREIRWWAEDAGQRNEIYVTPLAALRLARARACWACQAWRENTGQSPNRLRIRPQPAFSKFFFPLFATQDDGTLGFIARSNIACKWNSLPLQCKKNQENAFNQHIDGMCYCPRLVGRWCLCHSKRWRSTSQECSSAPHEPDDGAHSALCCSQCGYYELGTKFWRRQGSLTTRMGTVRWKNQWIFPGTKYSSVWIRYSSKTFGNVITKSKLEILL